MLADVLPAYLTDIYYGGNGANMGVVCKIPYRATIGYLVCKYGGKLKICHWIHLLLSEFSTRKIFDPLPEGLSGK